MPIIRMIGSMKDLNVSKTWESYVLYDELISNLATVGLPQYGFIDISIYVDGASPTPKAVGNSIERNGYRSKQLSYVREYSITTRRLFNHIPLDITLMKQLSIFHSYPHHYFTFWKKEGSNFISNHKSSLGDSYFMPLHEGGAIVQPGFIVATFESPSIKNNYADKNSQHSANRQYSWKCYEYGIRSVKDIIGG